MIRNTMLSLAVLALLLAGCGAKKGYVDEQIRISESKLNSQISSLNDKTDSNAGEISKLRTLAAELSSKTMELSEASGFENYQIIWSGEINFDFDSWEVTPTAEGILTEAGEVMERNASSLIEIAGHADPTGAAKYNLMLGEKRASSAKRFLAERFGMSLYRMFVLSYGEEKPIALPDEKQSASKNRRVAMKSWGPQ